MKKTTLAVVLLTGFVFCIQGATPPKKTSGRYISVTGKGSVVTIPNVVSLKLSIKKTDKNVASAKDETDKVLEQLNRVFSSLNIPTNKINTSQVYIYPAYDYIKGKQVLRGYEVTRDIVLTKIDVTKLNSLIQSSVKAGINNISQINLETTKKEELTQQALIKATENAKQRAKLLAVNFNASLGSIRSISTNNIHIQIPYINTSRMINKFALAENDSTPPPTHTGTIKINAEVQAVFDLEIVRHAQGL